MDNATTTTWTFTPTTNVDLTSALGPTPANSNCKVNFTVNVLNVPTPNPTTYSASVAGFWDPGQPDQLGASGSGQGVTTINPASPTISTTTNPSSGGTGANLKDSATLAGTSNLLGTGSITFYLFAPGVTCATNGTGAVHSETVNNISTNGPHTTPLGFGPPLVAGTYQWVAVFSGDANNSAAHSACGDEPVVITASPTISTTTNPSSGGTGANLKDSATLAGTSNLLGTGSITFYLFAPGVTCATNGTGAVHSETVNNISTNGPHTTPLGFVPAARGRHLPVGGGVQR